MEQPFELDLSLQIGKYDIRKQLGKGATGTVYLAVDTFSGKEVALKVIEPEVFKDPEFGAVYRGQFLNEASLAGKLKHPHIVSILDAVVQEDSGHIAMEVVAGGDLSQHVTADTLLPVADVLQIGFKCCGALAYAFAEGIVHRDIKPANLMIAQGTDVKIADFGAALLRKAQSVQTASIGSPYYMSPEQLEEAPLTHHSDMYCLGVALYELLTGQRPFTADSLQMLVQKILTHQPAPPSSVRPSLPKEIDRVVMRALGKKPEHRYATWDDFALELSNVGKLVLPPEAIMDSEKYVALKRVEMLANLSDAELWELTHAGRWGRVAAKQAIVRESEPGKSFFFLAQGQVKVTLGGHLLNTIGEGESFGEMAYIRGGEMPRHATVESMTGILLAEFEPEALDLMSLGAQLQLTRALVRNLVDRLELANARLAK
ncbi:MAG: serine/threonine protein kinase [Betaproteobacteria bacterium]|nr:MAG: serine/threonine protein kinase [Betaproteobacteria bacterium]